MNKPKVERYSLNSLLQIHTNLGERGVFITNGEEDIKDYFALVPHSIEGCVIGLVTAGEAKVSIDLEEYVLSEWMLIVMLPNSIVMPISFSDDLRMSSIVFTFDYVVPLGLIHDFAMEVQLKKCPVMTLNETDYEMLSRLYKLIGQCYYDVVSFREEQVLEHLLYALIIQVDHLVKNQDRKVRKISRAECITEDFFALLYTYYKREKSVCFYSSSLCISSNHLTTTIKKQTGHSILYWINEVVVLYAKSLLKSSSMNINEISEELGFKEATLFCRYFKRYTGLTPKQYSNG